MKKGITGFIAGIVFATMLSGAAYASGFSPTINVVFNSVNLEVNGSKVNSDNILYNGTTYVPLRAVAEMLGKEVGWNGNTNTASINEKSTAPAVSPSNQMEYIVKDQNGKELYSFKINNASKMSERNQFSDKNPAQVILIDFTYKNIANPEEVYLADIYFKVIDAGGKIGYSYPNSLTKYPQQIPVGVTCDAQMIFGVDTASNNITLNFYKNMFDSVATASFQVPVK